MNKSEAKAWCSARGWKPFAFQREVWAAMAAGESGLLHATTGSGKTYAVWLAAAGLTTVALRITAVTPTAGTPPRPVTWTSTTPFGPTWAFGAPLPTRLLHGCLEPVPCEGQHRPEPVRRAHQDQLGVLAERFLEQRVPASVLDDEHDRVHLR